MKKVMGVICFIAILTGCSKQIPCDDPEVMKAINSRIKTTLDNRAVFLASYLAGNDYRNRKSLGTEDFDKYIARLSKLRPERFRELYQERLTDVDMQAQHANTGAEARYYENAFKILNDPKAIMISTIGKPEMLLKANEGCNCRIVTNFSAVTFDHNTLDYKVNPNRRQLLIEYQTGLKDSRDNRLKITKQNVSVIRDKN